MSYDYVFESHVYNGLLWKLKVKNGQISHISFGSQGKELFEGNVEFILEGGNSWKIIPIDGTFYFRDSIVSARGKTHFKGKFFTYDLDQCGVNLFRNIESVEGKMEVVGEKTNNLFKGVAVFDGKFYPHFHDTDDNDAGIEKNSLNFKTPKSTTLNIKDDDGVYSGGGIFNLIPLKHGYGFLLKDDTCFEGNWKNNEKHGVGYFVWPDGDVQCQLYHEGKLISEKPAKSGVN